MNVRHGGYYGLIVITPPRPPHPQTIHHSHDNLKNPYRIASIFYMSDWYRSEDAWEARWAQSYYLWATQAPPNCPICEFFQHWGPYMQDWWLFFSQFRICLLCYEVLVPCNFRSPGFDVRPPPPPPNMPKMHLFFHILGLNFKMSYQIASLFHMIHRYGWEDSWKAR